MSETTGHVLRPEEGDARWFMGSLFDWKAVGTQTNGALAAVETTIQKGADPPVHVHTREDEVFYVLEGEMVFKVGDQVKEAPPGSFVFAPRGVPHGFAIRTDRARMLILIAPAGQEDVFYEFSEPAAARELPPSSMAMPDLEAVEARDREYGVTYLGPPISAEPVPAPGAS